MSEPGALRDQSDAANIRQAVPGRAARIVQLLVEGVDVRLHGVEVRLRACGLAGLAREVLAGRRAAA